MAKRREFERGVIMGDSQMRHSISEIMGTFTIPRSTCVSGILDGAVADQRHSINGTRGLLLELPAITDKA